MKMAILYICTGKYTVFWKGFYESAEKFLFTKEEKEYFVWTDDLQLCKAQNVHLIEKKCEGFPFDSLFRFKMFLQVKEQLKTFDYIYFFNSNAQFLDKIDVELLPKDRTQLVGSLWPIHRKIFTSPCFYGYERNVHSLAYVPPFHKPYYYFMGGLNGGESKAYIKMIEVLYNNIQTDYNNGIIAIAHDESHINKYFRSHPCTMLDKHISCPEEWVKGFNTKIIYRDKVKVDPSFNKGRDKSTFGKIKFVLRMLYRAIEWYNPLNIKYFKD